MCILYNIYPNNKILLSKVEWIDVPDFSFETFDEFEKSRKNIRKFVDRILELQKWIEFIASKKAWIDEAKWQKIFKIIEEARTRNNLTQSEIAITGGFVAKLHLIFWDKHIVSLLVLLIESWILSISDNRVNEILIELENKLYATHDLPGVDLLRTRTEIISEWWEKRYEWVLTDNYFDRRDVLLKKNGGRQLRTRERILTDGTITETLTGKRKIWSTWKDREYALSKFFEKLWEDVDVEKIEKYMKILLEDEMNIHDMEALEDILEILKFFVNRSKIKLRSSMKINATKVELEYYPWIEASKTESWYMRPFVEMESETLDESEEIRRLINLHGEHIVLSTDGSEWAFEFDGAWDSYLRFWNWGTLDSRVYLTKERIKRLAMRKMSQWYFDTFNV